MSKTERVKKSFDVLLLLHKHRATIYGMLKNGGRAKQYSVHCCLRNYPELVIFVFGSLFVTDYVS